FNAFAVATGNLYINIGALLRMRNEAELAAVLGHEGGHVLKDHTYRQVRSSKAMGVVGTILSAGLVAGIGIDPGLGAIASYSSMAGFSRDHERESDRVGFERMVAAGYDPQAGARIFDRMAREIQAREIKQGPYFFASHPRLQERVESYNELARNAPAGMTRRDEYVAATQAARLAALDAIVAGKNGVELAFVLSQDDLASELAPAGLFALGEGYRLRNQPGDEQLAVTEYRSCIERFPSYAPAWGALGRYYARRGNKNAAIEHLQRFLALAPDAKEAPFARQTLQRLENEVTQ
ncbi:MAG TPA: M48 family metalloprotease, partial [Steroidobacteraceae bacterium]